MNIVQGFLDPKKKKSTGLAKKKIQEIKNPELLIKANYKNKKLSIPITNIDEKGLMKTMISHIVRFEKEILSKFYSIQRIRILIQNQLKVGKRFLQMTH